MSSTSSKSSRNRRSSILKVRQTTVDSTVDVVEQPKNRRRVSFHHQKTVKEYDKEKHELSATSPLKESVKEAMSDFDSTKSNSTMMSLGTPDRTTGENNTMMLFRGMMYGGHPSSIHHETKDMSFSIIEDPVNHSDAQDETLNVFKVGSHVSIHSTTVDISYKMEESVNENHADDTMNVFGKPLVNQSARTISNMTMDMDISKADNTLTDGVSGGDDTMLVFGTVSNKKDTTILLLDDTMDVFTAANGSSEKSRMSQSILMGMSVNPSPVSSEDHTMAIFGKGSETDGSIPMDEATMVEEEKITETLPINIPTLPSMNIQSTTLNQSQSPSLDDTMVVFGLAKSQEAGDDDIGMDISMAMDRVSSMDKDGSPTMNLFKRKGDDEVEDTMNVFTSKRWKEDGDTCVVENGNEGPSGEVKASQESPEGTQKCEYMDEMDATMKIFGVKMEDTVDMSVAMEKEDDKKASQSIVEISTRTAIEEEEEVGEGEGEEEASTEKSTITALHNSDGDRTFDVLNGMGETSQMDLSGEGNETFGLFGTKEEDKDDTIQEETEEVKKEEKEKDASIDETQSCNQSITDEKSIDDGNGSADMEDVTPPSQSPFLNVERKRTRLSTVIEVSSRYTAASSQSMRERVESTEEERNEEGILDGMEGIEGESVDEREEEKKLEMDEQKSERMDEECMVDSASPSGNNTTFSTPFTKRSMLDETRLSDRSMLNITKSFEELVLEKIEWMGKEMEEGEMNEILKDEASRFGQMTNEDIERSERVVEGLLSHIAQLENGDVLVQSIVKLNPSKVQKYQVLFDWARREAQREWWEKREEKAENLNGELERKMKREEEELKMAKDDLIMMNKLNELKEDVEKMEREVEVGRGLNRNTIDELIGASKKKEEEKEKLEKEVNRMELERMKESTIALKIMTERCNAVDDSIKRKMEEREKNKRELRAYLSQLTNNLK